MSTKIYNGYKISGNSLDETIGKIIDRREDIKNLIEDKIKEDILYRAINYYYSFCFSSLFKNNNSKRKIENESSFGKVISYASKSENNLEMREHETVDVSFCLFPKKETVNNESYFLIMLFAGQYDKELNKSPLWKSLDIEEYAYWDNTDPPDTITEYEWDLRDKQWSNALGNSSPAEKSLIIEIKKEYKYNCIYFRDKEELRKNFEKKFDELMTERLNNKERYVPYYLALLKDKIAYKNCKIKYLAGRLLSDLSEEEREDLSDMTKQYSRENKLNDQELNTINVTLEKIKKVLDIPIQFDNLFEKRVDVIQNMSKILKIKKIKP